LFCKTSSRGQNNAAIFVPNAFWHKFPIPGEKVYIKEDMVLLIEKIFTIVKSPEYSYVNPNLLPFV